MNHCFRHVTHRLILLWASLALGLALTVGTTVRAEDNTSTPDITANTSDTGQFRIGVLAFDGKEEALSLWETTAWELEQRIKDTDFVIVPLLHQELEQAVTQKQVDFIITNPGHYVLMEHQYQVSRIATLKPNFNRQTYTRFGAVIFTRNDSGLHSLNDLEGKVLGAVSPNAFGGYQLALHELQTAQIDVDDITMEWRGIPQTEIVQGVMQGELDAGTVRTGILEQLAAQNRLNLDDVRVLNPRNNPNFPLLHSTALYPEWPFAAMAHTDRQLTEAVAKALLVMPEFPISLQPQNYGSWTIPLDYSEIHKLFQALKLEPYAPKPLTLATVWETYRPWIIALGLLALALITFVGVIVRNRTLADIRSQQRNELERVARLNTIGQMSSELAHELNQPLTAANNYISACQITLRQVEDATLPEKPRITAGLNNASQALSHASEVITNLRELLRKGETKREAVSIEQVLRIAKSLIAAELRRKNVILHTSLPNNLPDAYANNVHIQQVLLNLLRNAIDAVDHRANSERHVWVSAGVNDDLITVNVCDSGIGLENNIEHEQLFDTFFSTKDEGLGVGLAISRNLLEMHGGTIAAQPNYQFKTTRTYQGLCVSFTLRTYDSHRLHR